MAGLLQAGSGDYGRVGPRLESSEEDPIIDAAALQNTLHDIAADYTRRLGLRVQSIEADGVTLALPVSAELIHAGGVVCGQAIMAAADTAMLLAMIVRIGEFKPMTTVQLQTTFLRPIPKDSVSVSVIARVLRLGKSLSYGEIELLAPDGKLAAHATTTYALI